MKSPILITGCARSGTSMVAGIINTCGAFGGKMSGPTQYNAKGMFENAAIRNGITKVHLKSIGMDTLGQYPIPDTDSLMIPTTWKKQVEDIMISEGYESGPWMYKGAKLCLLWPIWHYAFPNAKWIIVRRKTPDIIRSCMRTGFMRAFSNPRNQKAVGVDNEYDGWLWWVRQHEDRFREMMNAGLNTTVVWPERMVEGDYRQMKETVEWVGLEWKGEEVTSFIEPKLWKARQTQK
jgi:hypothetical protein